MCQLAAGCHNPGPAALAYGCGEMLLLEYFLEFLNTVWQRTFEGRSRILVERNKVDLGPETAQELRQLSGIRRRVVDISKQEVFKGNPLTTWHLQLSASLQQLLQ